MTCLGQVPEPPERTGILNLDGHSQVVQTLRPVSDEKGNWRYVTNSFTQVELGLNYLSDDGQWIPASEEIEIVPGGAIAWKGQHKASFAENLNVGDAVQLRLPDDKLLVSHVVGLAYYESTTGRSVLLGEVQDSHAWVYPPNQVLYPKAFDGVDADVRYTYTKGGFEQDIILRSTPPAPEEFGLDPFATRLEVWTEFVEAPEAERSSELLTDAPVEAGEMIDETVNFGAMRLGTGKTFTLGNEDDNLALVAKQWITTEGRIFLIEAVAVKSVADQLLALPPADQGGASLKQPMRSRMQALNSTSRKPIRSEPNKGQAARRIEREAQIAQLQRKGLVLDYTTINTTLTNYTFRSDRTYYVSGLVTLSGTNSTFEGGTVIKFASTNTPKIVVNTPIAWRGGIYQPVVFTAKDDKSVGELVGTNTLTGYYADTALDLQAGTANTTFSLAHLRISYAKKAIVLNQRAGHVLSHVQLVSCQNGINPTSTDFSLRNALFYNVLTNFNGSSATNRTEHLTVNTASWFNYNSTFSAANLKVTNSLLIAVTNAGSYTGVSVSTASSPSGLFQAVGGGSHYLASASSYRNAGNTGISLTKEFRQMSTYPPTAWSTAVTVDTWLTPQVQRDTDTPDLGYHYPVLDYYTSSHISVTNATLTVTNGTAIAFGGDGCFLIRSKSSLVNVGRPEQLNVSTRYSAVQEGAVAGVSAPSYLDTFISPYAPGASFSDTPTIDCRFAASYLNTPGGYQLYLDSGNFMFELASMKDMQFYGGSVYVENSTANTPSIQLNNNLLLRTAHQFVSYGSPISLSVYNQLNRLGSYDFLTTVTNNGWLVRDNAFDTCSVAVSASPITYSHNAYIATNGLSQILPLAGTDKVLSTFTYASTANGLGPWYHGQTNLANAGSRNANVAGLYHKTTVTAQTKDANTVVDIGFHYVAVDGNGNPLDTGDSDGFPDYFEDSNGNGTVDSGETAWTSAGDLGLKVWISKPRAGSNLP